MKYLHDPACLTTHHRLLVSVFLLLGMAGCEPSNKPILPTVAGESPPKSESNAVSISHPEFANWSRFEVGAGVVRFRVTTNQGGEVRVRTALSLTQKSSEAIEFASQITVERPGEPVEENPEERTKVPATFRLPEGLTEEYFQLPSPKAKLLDQESMDVFGKKVLVDIYQWIESNETGPMTVKLWHSDEVPGRIVRQEMLIESSQTKTVEELLEVRWN